MRHSKRSSRSVMTLHRMEPLEQRLLLAVVNVSTVSQLMNAVNNGSPGDTIHIAAGTYAIPSPLMPKSSMTLQGAGAEATIITNASSWVPGTAMLPDNGINESTVNPDAYLFNLGSGTTNVRILDMKLTGPQLHGALYGNNPDGLELGRLHVEDFLWSGIRTFRMDNARIHNSTFVNTGGRWLNGSLVSSGGTTGGAIYVTNIGTSEIDNNRFYRTTTTPERNFYGIKGRKATHLRIHHNTIETNFTIEFPHENDAYVEIDHNYLRNTVSIPKNGGGTVPAGGYTFHIHHNYFRQSYSLEWARNGAEVSHNLFDFSTSDDVGNLITNFANPSATLSNGPLKFHNNLVKNPGRGLYASNGHVYNNMQFYNNHIIGNTTVTPRTDGMFGFPTTTDFSTIHIRDNIFEFNGTPRPLFRNTASYGAQVSNNTLINVSDSGNYANPNTGAVRGPVAPLRFQVGVNGQYTVDGWNIAPTSTMIGDFTQTQDIGSVGLAGSASHASGVYTVAGSGSDIAGNADAFRFLFNQVSGNVAIVARVDSQTNTNPHAKAGLMIRETLDPNARNVFIGLTPDNGVRFSRRTTVGGSTSGTNFAGPVVPYWIRLERIGNSFRAFHSPNGTAWTQIGVTVNLAMNANSYVGLAVTSRNNAALSTATYSNLSLSQPVAGTTTSGVPKALTVPSLMDTLRLARGNRTALLTFSIVPITIQLGSSVSASEGTPPLTTYVTTKVR